MSEEKKVLNGQTLENTSGGIEIMDGQAPENTSSGIKSRFDGITCPRCGASEMSDFEALMYWEDGRMKVKCKKCGWEFIVI